MLQLESENGDGVISSCWNYIDYILKCDIREPLISFEHKVFENFEVSFRE